MRYAVLFVPLLLAGLAHAQEPVVRMELAEPSAIPGQPIVLRLSVLVPTFMTSPPEFPSLEVPNVMVRLPERASGPISERVEGETWSGVGRSYRLYPMTAGRFEIPAQPLTITWSDPATSETTRTELMTETVVIEGVVPEEAAGLSPFLGATSVTLEQTLEGDPQNLEAGGSLTRRVTVSIKGVTPYAIPPVLTATDADGLGVYPKDPSVSESDDRGALSGRRIEEVTYIAEQPGRYMLDPLELPWFNIESQAIEITTVDSVEIVVTGATAPAPAEEIDWRSITFIAALGVVCVGALLLIWRFLWPPLKRGIHTARHVWEASEHYAYRALKSALRGKDINATMLAYQVWAHRLGDDLRSPPHAVADAFAGITSGRYGKTSRGPEAREWSRLAGALRDMRQAYRKKKGQKPAELAPLNPTA